MELLLNGETLIVPEPATVASLIEHLGLSGKRIAVEVNEDIVARSAHANTFLQAGDRVEIVHAIGGG